MPIPLTVHARHGMCRGNVAHFPLPQLPAHTPAQSFPIDDDKAQAHSWGVGEGPKDFALLVTLEADLE